MNLKPKVYAPLNWKKLLKQEYGTNTSQAFTEKNDIKWFGEVFKERSNIIGASEPTFPQTS